MVQQLDVAGGLPLALFASAEYDTAAVHLEPGDSIVAFTDGITEAMNASQDLYGEERLVQLLAQQTAATPVEEIVRAVIAGAYTFADGAPASDDMTVLGIRYSG